MSLEGSKAARGLDTLEAYMQKEGYDVWRHTHRQGATEMNCLCLNLPDDEFGKDRVVQFLFLPLPELDAFKGLDCLQVFYELPVSLDDENLDATLAALDTLNNVLLAGHLSIAEHTLFYRYSYFIPRLKAVKEEQYVEHIIFLIATVVGFTELLRQVNNGQLDYDGFTEAVGQLQQFGNEFDLNQ